MARAPTLTGPGSGPVAGEDPETPVQALSTRRANERSTILQHPEAAGGSSVNEPVERRPQGARCVDRVLPHEAALGEHGKGPIPRHGFARGHVLPHRSAGGRAQRRR